MGFFVTNWEAVVKRRERHIDRAGFRQRYGGVANMNSFNDVSESNCQNLKLLLTCFSLL